MQDIRCFNQKDSMKTPKKKNQCAFAVAAFLVIGGATAAYVTKNMPEDKQGKGNIESRHGPGGMRHMENITAPGPHRTALTEETRNEMEIRRNRTNAAIDAAIADGDYDEWKAAIDDLPGRQMLLEVITEENFPRYVEMQKHFQKAKDISEELGLPQRGGMPGRGPGGRH
jgi:hypothetical protein